jgi:hypothetical protein
MLNKKRLPLSEKPWCYMVYKTAPFLISTTHHTAYHAVDRVVRKGKLFVHVLDYRATKILPFFATKQIYFIFPAETQF